MLSGTSIAYRVIGIVTTIVTLGCVYLFIIAPILDTTNKAIDSVSNSFDGFGPALEQATDVSPQAEKAIRQAQKLQAEQAAATQAQVKTSNRLLTCMREADGDVDEVQRCAQRFNPAPE